MMLRKTSLGDQLPKGLDLWSKQLRLSKLDLLALRRQGSVHAEVHGRKVRYKLRFRINGKQRVIIIGTNTREAMQLKRLLSAWQSPLKELRELKQLGRKLRREERNDRKALAQSLANKGLHYVGRTLRKKRPRR